MKKIFPSFHNNTCTKLASIFLIILLLTVLPAQFVNAFPVFGTTNSASIAGTFNDVAINANSSNVYVAYTDSTTNIGVAASSDNGTTFPHVNSFFACVACPIAESKPQLAVSGKYLYVTWLDGDGNIAFARSDNSGTSFAGVAPKELTAGGGQLSGPHIAVYGNNVYLQWINNLGKVAFIANHNSGAGAWDAIKVISTTNQIFDPQIDTSKSNVYITWEDKSVDASGDINSTVLSQNGTITSSSTNPSNTPGQASIKPQIAAFKSSVYQAWEEKYNSTNGDIFFASSANNATSFGSKINLSNSAGLADNPAISANDSKVYVAWQDATSSTKNEILFKSSSNNGTTFGSVVNLSDNSGDSVFPRIALSNNNVYVVWEDKTIDGSGDILFRASSDGGATFGGLKKINTNLNAINDGTDQISASTKNVSVVWSDTANHVSYASATVVPVEVQFSAAQYALNATATVTVTNSSANTNPATIQSVSVNVVSTTDGTGIASLILNETGVNTGIFSGTLHFSSGSTSGTTLKATPGDVITATYSGQSSIASILPVVIAFDSPSGYDRGAFAHLTVTDNDANVDPTVSEKITVHLVSTANPSGIDIVLTETGPNTGVFGSLTSDTFVFMDSNNLFPSSGTVTITQTNTGQNVNPNAIDSILEQINSTSDMAGIKMALNETGINTGTFSGKLKLSTGASVNRTTIHVSPGDFVSVTRGFATENAMITPNANPSHGALLVTADPIVDNITASYRGVEKSTSVSKLFDSGGSGGGLVRPGLILDVIASLHGGGNNPVPPTFDLTSFAQNPGNLPENIRQEVLKHDPTTPISPHTDSSYDYPLIIDGGGYVLGGYQNTLKTVSEKTGTPIDLKLNLPATNLEHLALYTNLSGKSREITDSDTYIIYDKGGKLQKVDPNGYFSDVKFDLDTQGVTNKIEYHITFAKPMDTSDIIFRAWNDRMSSSDVKLVDAIKVEQSQVTSASEIPPQAGILQTAPIPSQQTEQSATDIISTIKDWAGFSSHPISDSELLSQLGIEGSTIPHWVSTTAKYVTSNDLSPEQFQDIVKYLASNGIIK